MAQQSPINEAKSLSLDSEVKTFSEESKIDNIIAIKAYLDEGIHFIGFDAGHVGYILKQENELYLIHSNYINAIGVEIEQIEKSDVFSSYDKFYIVPLSSNENLLKHWLKNEPVEVVTK